MEYLFVWTQYLGTLSVGSNKRRNQFKDNRKVCADIGTLTSTNETKWNLQKEIKKMLVNKSINIVHYKDEIII